MADREWGRILRNLSRKKRGEKKRACHQNRKTKEEKRVRARKKTRTFLQREREGVFSMDSLSFIA